MARWATPPVDRGQTAMFPSTLDQTVCPDHPVRIMDEILRGLDWAAWEAHYVLLVGQPPIHPRVVAGAILYGMTLGIRSSRRLEWACGNAIDFLWLVQGEHIDHSRPADAQRGCAADGGNAGDSAPAREGDPLDGAFHCFHAVRDLVALESRA